MKLHLRFFAAFAAAWGALSSFAAVVNNPQAVSDMLNRIGGSGTADRFVTVLDETIADGSDEVFVITAADGKPCIKGSTLSALTTGIGWYLNHNANVNLTWNRLTADLSAVSLPAPAGEEKHSTGTKYRYYMNFCTFSYSASTWTWDRWQKEIDWMALHGINMPLQIVGLEEVWRQFLMEDYDYSKDEANDFVAGPCFMAWFGMNNLQGHGGPNPDWWYTRQAELGRKMNARMEALGMSPVLPGYAGSVPSNFQTKTGISAIAQGGWCGFTRPALVDPNNDKFAEISARFYSRVKSVMGDAKFYAIDPFHEGANTSGIDVPAAYTSLYNALTAADAEAQWVIQSWQWSGAQKNVLDRVPKGKLVVLDLYSDGRPGWNNYKGHDVVYSTIFNFGARTGLFGRFNGIIDGFFKARAENAKVLGIGAAPEGIEQTPVMYDLLFELPWHSTKPDAATWMANYTRSRYGVDNNKAKAAWEVLRTTALNRTDASQGPQEAVICGRPNLVINKVSSWGFSDLHYNPSDLAGAAYNLFEANLGGDNYSYDLVDVTRQALTDYGKSLLAGLKEANDAGDNELFAKRRDAFLQLILDLDELLNTNKLFTLGHWTETARAIADEAAGTTSVDRDWLELNNARTIITTWGPQNSSENGGLRDYSYREWGGMMKDFYYQRWKTWFDNGMKAPNGGWFKWEWNWAHSNPDAYKAVATGDTREVASRLLPKYLSRFNNTQIINRLLTNDFTGTSFRDRANRSQAYTPAIDAAGTTVTRIAIDFNRNKRFDEGESVDAASFSIPADAPIGEREARVELADGTVVTYTVAVVEEITEARTVSVASADPALGSASIDGSDALSVTNTDPVTVRATATDAYDFSHWTDAAGNNLGNDNPFTYYGKDPVSLTANFVLNKWGVPDGSTYSKSDVARYNQYATAITATQGGNVNTLYTASAAPETGYISVPTRIRVAPGGELTIDWKDAGGFNLAIFLSAYADFNGDGTFTMSAPELIETRGTYHGNDASVAKGNMTVLVPYDATKGATHMRLRFDSSWNDKAWDATAKAMRPDGSSNRLMYELMLDIVDAPDYPCTITYSPSNSAFASMRSENETMVYTPGEEVIITAFPNPGCSVKRWLDNHGRELPAEWVDGNSVRFKAFDNLHVTCELEAEPLNIDGWTLDWEPNDNGSINLTTAVDAGLADVDLSELNVYTIAPEVFANAGALNSITLPATELKAPGKVIYAVTAEGDGTQNKQFTPSKTITGTTPWIFTIKGNYDGSTSYNQWGTPLYANGDNALADNYSGGWSQFYLTKAGTLNVKWNSATEVKFEEVNLTGDFTIVSQFDGAKSLTVTVTNALGQSQTKEIANSSTMRDIERFAVCLPTDMNVSYTFTEPDVDADLSTLFVGCHALTDVNVPASHPSLSSKNGIVYNKTGKTMKFFPDGRIHRPLRLRSGSDYLTAAPVQTAGVTADAATATAADATLDALWQADGDDRFVHVNSGLALDASVANISSTAGAVSHSVSCNGAHADVSLNSNKYQIEEVEAITVVAYGITGVTFPCAVSVPDGVEALTVTGINASGVITEKLSDIIPANTPVLLRGINGSADFAVETELPAAQAETLMRGSCVRLANAGSVYLLNGSNFVLTDNAAVEANTVYIPAVSVPDGIGNSFAADPESGITGVDNISNDSHGAPLYDLQGRRAPANPLPGLYIRANRLVRL